MINEKRKLRKKKIKYLTKQEISWTGVEGQCGSEAEPIADQRISDTIAENVGLSGRRKIRNSAKIRRICKRRRLIQQKQPLELRSREN